MKCKIIVSLYSPDVGFQATFLYNNHIRAYVFFYKNTNITSWSSIHLNIYTFEF